MQQYQYGQYHIAYISLDACRHKIHACVKNLSKPCLRITGARYILQIPQHANRRSNVR